MAQYQNIEFPSSLSGIFSGKDVHVAIVTSSFNQEITSKLQESAVATLGKAGLVGNQVEIIPAPGVFEIPIICRHILDLGGFFGIICLGAVIQGETDHHTHLAQSTFVTLQQLSVDTGVPITAGILTTKNWQQAEDRAGGRCGNKGVEATLALLQTMVALWQFENRHAD